MMQAEIAQLLEKLVSCRAMLEQAQARQVAGSRRRREDYEQQDDVEDDEEEVDSGGDDESESESDRSNGRGSRTSSSAFLKYRYDD
jgi:hypothetical protein